MYAPPVLEFYKENLNNGRIDGLAVKAINCLSGIRPQYCQVRPFVQATCKSLVKVFHGISIQSSANESLAIGMIDCVRLLTFPGSV